MSDPAVTPYHHTGPTIDARFLPRGPLVWTELGEGAQLEIIRCPVCERNGLLDALQPKMILHRGKIAYQRDTPEDGGPRGAVIVTESCLNPDAPDDDAMSETQGILTALSDSMTMLTSLALIGAEPELRFALHTLLHPEPGAPVPPPDVVEMLLVHTLLTLANLPKLNLTPKDFGTTPQDAWHAALRKLMEARGDEAGA
jgi:hypothetical protein